MSTACTLKRGSPDAKDAQFTLEMEADTQYEVYMNEVSAGEMKTNLSGKLSVSVELGQDEAVSVKIVKK